MASTHRGIALLIGMSIYDNQENIDSALNDVSEMSRCLSTCDYEVIEAINLEIADIKIKVSLLVNRLYELQHREVLVYYAGHGLVHNDEHFIVGRQYNDNARSQNNEINCKCLSVEREIIDNICSISCLEEEETRSLAVILDTCRSRANMIKRGITSSSLLSDSFKLRHEVKIGILVGYACTLGFEAKDNGDGNHGLYTDCILKSIFEPGKRIIDALSSANLLAAKRTNTHQRPFIYVNYPNFFHYPLIQGATATDETQRMCNYGNSLLQNEHEKLKLEKEKLEQEFKRVQKEFEMFRLESNQGKISDMDVMKKLYKSTGGLQWRKNKGRLNWQLDECSSEFRKANGRITYINLRKNNLIDLIPSELGRLSGLTYLNLSHNKLEGTIPVEFGELRNLEHLHLHGNQLTGGVPVELGKLSKLESLYLFSNQLIGSIPEQLGNLCGLRELCLRSNKLTDSIPASFSNLTNLKKLSLRDNQLTGPIPLELGKLSKLEVLYLYENQLTGAIPIELGELMNLTHLFLYKNQLTGTIPIELGKLSRLQGLGLHENQLIGTIPIELGKLSKLEWLELHSNQLTGGPPIIHGCNIIFHPQRP